MASDALRHAIDAITALGGLAGYSVTRDGGALVFLVTLDGETEKMYYSNCEEAEAGLIAVGEAFAEATINASYAGEGANT